MIVRDQLAEQGIRPQRYGQGSHKTTCPKCSANRKKKTAPCLSVTVEAEAATWLCHHCSWSGAVHDRREDIRSHRPSRKQPLKIEYQPAPSLPPAVIDWFERRGIPAAVLARNAVGHELTWMPGCENGESVGAIAFPYKRDGEVVNVKYRTSDKRFRQVKDAEKVYFGLDDIAGATTVIIVEGEIDKLSLEVAGFLNAVSVPDGAPKQVRDGALDPEDDAKFSYVWTCREAFEGVTKIVLAVDNDTPGEALAEELARRYGKHRCWRVTWPSQGDVTCKDANEVLTQHGADVLREVIENARPYPIKSLHDADAFETPALRLFRGEGVKAFRTGWPSLDEFYKVRPGELSVVTGDPGSGKSQFIDALMMNLAEREKCRFALCSFENPPDHHIAKLAELHLDKPFWPGPRERMTEAELRETIGWLNERFYFIRADDESPTIDWVLETATSAVMRHGIHGLVIDPYNEIEHRRPPNQTETEYVSDLLGKVKRFAQSHGVHVWFVAHPAKPARGKDGSPAERTLYDISGSANWVNKADVGIVVQRDYESSRVDIKVRKVRFKEIGRIGTATLEFDRATGRYSNAA